MIIMKNLKYPPNCPLYIPSQCKTDLSAFADYNICINGYADIKMKDWLNLIELNRGDVKILY